jgi:N-methylhydantoinase A
MTQQPARLGVDIGGTFTDVVLEVGGNSFSTKVLTTYIAPENAIIDGLQQVCGKAGIAPSEITQIIHGTTLATNALIERRGAKTALITTEGFRDVIEMRTESRFEQYDLNLNLPEPLLARHMRFTVPGRMDASGNELKTLTRADIEPVVEQIKAAGYESVAVGLIHSYLNDSHEQLVREVLLDLMPDAMVSLSCEVSPQMREYERFNTVVANAYIKPLMKSYRKEQAIRNRIKKNNFWMR